MFLPGLQGRLGGKDGFLRLKKNISPVAALPSSHKEHPLKIPSDAHAHCYSLYLGHLLYMLICDVAFPIDVMYMPKHPHLCCA